MANNTALTVIPSDVQLPARLRTPEAAAAIAAANAAAAGGIKSGSFPKLSKKGGKFHIVDGDEEITLMNAPESPGQPALPMMLLGMVVIGANPAISKHYYEGEYQPGDAKEPDCKSADGIRPDASVTNPQSTMCATCPKNQWGSKISKLTGKDSKACTDTKQIVVVPRADLKYKALGLAITPSELKDWGTYVKALSQRNIPVTEVQTNITFDTTATHPKLLFSFGGVLTDEEAAIVAERMKGDDVKTIVSPTPSSAALPAPQPSNAAPAPTPVQEATTAPTTTVATPAAATPLGFPASAPAATTEAAPATAAGFPPSEPAKRSRAPRKPNAEAVQATTLAATQAAAQATAPLQHAVAAAVAVGSDPFAGLPPHVQIACEAAGPAGSPAYTTVYKALAGKDYAPPQVPATAPPVTVPTGFPAPAPTTTVAPGPAAASPGQSLKDKLAAAIAKNQQKVA